ncbi:hypothetical protein [Pseudomonas fluorescens]|nr:hypothetical protein [Pseudomonas fluorescens]
MRRAFQLFDPPAGGQVLGDLVIDGFRVLPLLLDQVDVIADHAGLT